MTIDDNHRTSKSNGMFKAKTIKLYKTPHTIDKINTNKCIL